MSTCSERWDAFVDALRRASDEGRVVEDAAALLLEAGDWAGLAAHAVRALSDGEFAELARGGHVPGTEPAVYPLHSEPGRFEVALNVFDRQRFEGLLASRTIGPHRHRFPFATRILRGGYVQWLYRTPEPGSGLRFAGQSLVDVASVYTLRPEQFHMVLRPQDGTTTLMVRGPSLSSLGDRCSAPASIAEARQRLLDLLAGACEKGPGRWLDPDADRLAEAADRAG